MVFKPHERAGTAKPCKTPFCVFDDTENHTPCKHNAPVKPYQFVAWDLLFESLVLRDLEIYAESMEAELYHYQDYDRDEIDAVIQTPDSGWSAFEVKLGADQVDDAAASLVRIASKFKRNPPTSLAVIVGKSGIAYRRSEDGVYVLPITALMA